MGLFNQNNKESVIGRMVETKLFEYVMDELADGNKQRGIWGQAMVECEGNETKAEAAYIKLRVQSLKDEITLGNIIEDEALKAIQAMVIDEEAKNAQPKKKRSKWQIENDKQIAEMFEKAEREKAERERKKAEGN